MATVTTAAHKGGAGKTTLTASVAAALAGGRRVLAVDSDPQGALGAALAVDDAKPTLYEVLNGTPASEAIRPTAVAGLDVLPADLDLAGVELELPRRARWQTAMRDALAPVATDYDVVFIDTAPGLGVLPYLSLAAGDHALIACPASYLSYRALRGVLATIDQVRQVTPGLRLLGIAPTMVGGRTRHESEVLAELQAHYADLLLPATPRRVAVEDAAIAGQPIGVYAPGSDVAAAFTALAKEVLRRAQTPHTR